VFLLFASFLALGTAMWALLGLGDWLVVQRPPVVVEAFLSEVATPGQVDQLMRSIQERDFCCEARFVSADEARAEASRNERVRSILEAYGANPFLRSFRVTLCPASVPQAARAAEWLGLQPGVASVRVPESSLARLAEGEAALDRTVRLGALALLGLALLVGAGSLWMMAYPAMAEVRVYSALGARPWLLAFRAAWALVPHSAGLAALAALLFVVASLVARVSGSLPWPGLKGFAPASLPVFTYGMAFALAGAGLLAGLATGLAILLRVVLKRER
jgi:hypothetical protein